MANSLVYDFPAALCEGAHNFDTDTFKLAMYNVRLDPSITAYTNTGEVVAQGYTAGGNELTINFERRNGAVSITASPDIYDNLIEAGIMSALIYNSTTTNPINAISVYDMENAVVQGRFEIDNIQILDLGY